VRMHHGHLNTTDYIGRLRVFLRFPNIATMDRPAQTSFM
jgi:hypothetical protein